MFQRAMAMRRWFLREKRCKSVDRALALGSFSLILWGCSRDPGPVEEALGDGSPYVTSTPSAGCTIPEPCDILEKDCQYRWIDVLACLRGRAPMIVPIRTISLEKYEQELRDNTGIPHPDNFLWNRAYALLGFVPEPEEHPSKEPPLDTGFVAAYYSSLDKRITIIDRGWPADSITQNALLLHELVHAAQDQEFGFESVWPDELPWDQFLATRSLIEGEAEVYEAHAYVGLNGLDEEQVDYAGMFEMRSLLQLAWSYDSSAPFYNWQSNFPYSDGAALMYSAYAKAGYGGMRDLFVTPPVTTRQVLLRDLQIDTAPIRTQDYADVPGHVSTDLRLVGTTSFGAFGALLYAGRPDGKRVRKSLPSFVGDRLDVFTDGFGVALAWQMRFSNEAQATAYFEVARAFGLGARTIQLQNLGEGELVLLGGSDTELGQEVARALESAF